MTLSTPRDPTVVKKMADLLRAGAAMLSERCPVCGLPLFRLRSGEIVCPIHGRVYLVKDESELSRIAVRGVLEELEKHAASRIASIVREAGNEDSSIERLRGWLDVLERTERILNLIGGPAPASAREASHAQSKASPYKAGKR